MNPSRTGTRHRDPRKAAGCALMSRRARRVITTRALWALTAVAVVCSPPPSAQQSTSYRITEWSLNSAGRPLGGVIASSPGYRITLDAVGDLQSQGLASASYRLDGSFASTHRPPDQVLGLGFGSKTLLAWSPEPSAVRYQVYRGLVGGLPGSFGGCLGTTTGTSTPDIQVPSVGASFFYLVTARNSLAEEGTKGFQSSGAPRPNSSPCP